MGRMWTAPQKNAITATNGTVLVSAAAGSGKTAVLVERVIRLITREENPVPADRLLIVTFTRAAAAEMRQRIAKELNKFIEKDPYNPALLKQKQLLYNATISTIDSFCGDLVREYFHSLEISRDFKIADDGELDILKSAAMDSTLEEFYSRDEKSFADLLAAFSSKAGDLKLRETVLKISDFLSTQPFPDMWLENMLESYGEHSIAKSIWGKIIIENAMSTVDYAINIAASSISLLDEDEKLKSAFSQRLYDDEVYLKKLKNKLENGSWDEISSLANSFEAGRLTAPRGYKDDPLKDAISKKRDKVKKSIGEVAMLFSVSEQEARLEMEELQKIVATLFDVVTAYIAAFDELKAKRNLLSFSDIELLTVKLLATPCKGGYEKTERCNEISARFDYVMVDEFQDVNDVQDLIFKCVSTNEENLFMVGDVKQSIYGFRQAKPQIFINRKNLYPKYDEENPAYPATIILDKNFRSRNEVCSAVNFIFSRLMSEQAAQMDYTEDEMLNTGAVYPESDSCNFEIAMIEKTAFEDFSSAEAEARYIARRIHKMVGSGMTVKSGDIQREITYGDFAVILRKTKNIANVFVKTLQDCGIRAFSETKENFFEAREIKLALNMLRIIDNPMLDIPLLSVLCSPLYGFTPDELSQMRSESRYDSLFISLKKYSNDSDKAKAFLEQLNTLRAYSYASSVDELIGKVYELTSIGAITAAVKGGASAMGNLNILRAYARSFESNGYKTLSDFIAYADKLISNGRELASASDESGDKNAVRVLSIHASKGLEYPVCFIADAAHGFNKTDLKEDVLIDSIAGLGIKKKEGICRFKTLPRTAVEIEIEKNSIAEELRILYVALTRAREKLIIVASHSNTEKYLTQTLAKVTADNSIEPYSVLHGKSICDWIMMCALVHPSFNKLRYSLNNSRSPIFEAELPWEFELINKCEQLVMTNTAIDTLPDPLQLLSDGTDYLELLQENLAFKYRNESILVLPQKVSASEIAHSESDYFEKVLQKPAFLSEEKITAVERGSANHLFLQHCDFSLARKSVKSEIERLYMAGAITEKQSELINVGNMSGFMASSLVERIINSNSVLKEERFTAQIKASEIYDDYKAEQDPFIIMQGAVDLLFEENGELVIVDYKTDRVGEVQKLSELYSKQLKLYKTAIEQSSEMKVKECIIYSLHLGEYITVN